MCIYIWVKFNKAICALQNDNDRFPAAIDNGSIDLKANVNFYIDSKSRLSFLLKIEIQVNNLGIYDHFILLLFKGRSKGDEPQISF